MNKRSKVVLLDDSRQTASRLPVCRRLAEIVDLQIHNQIPQSRGALRKMLASAEIVVTFRDRVEYDAELLRGLPKLKYLSVCGPKHEFVDLDVATECGILVSSSPLPVRRPHLTAEHTWAMVLALAKGVGTNHLAIRSGTWQAVLPLDLRDKVLGLVGLGRVGTGVARIAQAFEMRTTAWSPNLEMDRASSVGVERAGSLAELLRVSDVVSIHARIPRSAPPIFGTSEFNQMKRTSFLVNTSRARVVDESALKSALESGAIAGAGLDVFWTEPLPNDHWLLDRNDVLLQPHVAGFSDEVVSGLFEVGIKAVFAYLDGEPIWIRNRQANDAHR